MAETITRAGDDAAARCPQALGTTLSKRRLQVMMHSMSEPRAIGRADVAVTAVMTVLGIALMVLNVVAPDPGVEPASWLVVPAFLFVTLPLAWRRTAPVAALAIVLVALAINSAAFGEVTRCGVVIPLVWLLVFAAAARSDALRAVAGLALGLLALLTMMLDDPFIDPASLTFFGPATAAVWGIGRVVNSRARLGRDLRERTNELKAARDERARLEVATDRARLSAELDELLQRRLGELARMATAGAEQADGSAASAALAEIENSSRRTLEEMRTLVGVLRHDESAPTAPQPTLTHLEALLVRAKGTRARLRVDGSPRALPAGVELSAYRVVEHLLDALEDAADVEVTVRFGDSALELSVSGPPRRRAEAALERARERVKLHDGTLTATTRGGRSQAIAQLPVTAGA